MATTLAGYTCSILQPRVTVCCRVCVVVVCHRFVACVVWFCIFVWFHGRAARAHTGETTIHDKSQWHTHTHTIVNKMTKETITTNKSHPGMTKLMLSMQRSILWISSGPAEENLITVESLRV